MKNWKLFLKVGLVVLVMGGWGSIAGQATGDYRSFSSGNWATVASWERWNGSSWVNPAPAAPNNTVGAIEIQSIHTITVGANVTVDQLTINGNLTINSGVTFSTANGTGEEITLNGTMLHSGTVPGTMTGTGTINSTGTYIHNTSSSAGRMADFFSTINSGSTWIFRGSSNVTPAVTLSGRTFYNLTFDVSSGSYTVIPNGGGGTTVNGDFTIGSGVTITNQLTGTSTFVGNFTNNGTITNSIGTQIYSFIGIGKTIGGSTATEFEIFSNSASASTTLSSNISIASTFSSTINGTLDCSTFIISGAGTFTLATNATLKTANANGISGSITTSTKNFQNGANYEFNGGDQTFGALPLPGVIIKNLTLAGSGIKTATDDRTITGDLTINSGVTLQFTNAPPAKTYEIKGDFINNGMSIPPLANSIFNFNGASTQTIGGTSTINFATLNISNTVDVNKSFGTTAHISIITGGLLDLADGVYCPIGGQLYFNTSPQYEGTWGSYSSSATHKNNEFFAGIGILDVPNGLPLPVELVSFTARKQQQATALNWETASELDNEKFQVERSTNGMDFRVIGEVMGHGTTHLPQNYNFLDRSPAAGINYYRLKQIDFDGQFEYSKVVSVEFSGVKGHTQVFPAYVDQLLQVRFPEATTEAGTFRFFDVNGRVTKIVEFGPGTIDLKIHATDLQPGIHILYVQNGHALESFKLVKQ